MRRGRAVSVLLRSPYLSAILCLVLVSGTGVMVRGVAFETPPLALVFWRNVVGVAVLMVFAWPYLRVELPFIRSRWRPLLLCGFLHVVLGNAATVIGLHSTTMINASVMGAFLPAVTVIFATALGYDRVNRLQVGGIALSFVGVLILISHGDIATFANLAFNRGDLWILLSIVSFSLYNAIVREAAPGMHLLSMTAAVSTFGLVSVTPLYIWQHFFVEAERAEWSLVIAASYMGIAGTFIAMILWNRAVRLIGPARTGPMNNLGPVFGTAAGMIFLSEELELYHLVGVMPIAAGIYLATFLGRSLKKRAI